MATACNLISILFLHISAPRFKPFHVHNVTDRSSTDIDVIQFPEVLSQLSFKLFLNKNTEQPPHFLVIYPFERLFCPFIYCKALLIDYPF